MEGPFGPVLKKIAAEILSKPRRTVTTPSQVCLEDWYLSKPISGQGIVVSGRPVEISKIDDTLESSNSATAKRTRAVREFNSAKIVKRYGCTTIESSDGAIISLCGFINKSRTQQNGFSSEVCRDFIYGFPFNWDDYATQSFVEDSRNQGSLEGFKPDALELYNGAQLHELVLSLTDAERVQFNETCYNNLLKLLDPEADSEVIQAVVSSTSSLEVEISDHTVTQGSRKRKKVPLPDTV